MITYTDTQGREHAEVDGYRFALIKIIPFEQWLQTRFGKTMNDFMNLKRPEREEIFLRWKWGASESKSNLEAEASRKQLMYQIKDIKVEEERPAYQFFISNLRNFERICFETLQSIGCAEPEKKDQRMVEIMDKFKGRFA